MDVRMSGASDTPATEVHAFGEEDFRQGMEQLFFAYRDFIAEPDAILKPLGYGRAHHRVIFFVGRYPGMAVSELLEILQITKQSLSRVLGQLIRDGYIVQQQGTEDRRQRRLHLTSTGCALERQLSEDQRHRFERAYANAGTDAVAGFRRVLAEMISRLPPRSR